MLIDLPDNAISVTISVNYDEWRRQKTQAARDGLLEAKMLAARAVLAHALDEWDKSQRHEANHG